MQKDESPEQAKKVLMSMKENVPMIKGIEVGVDELRSDRSFDVILTVLLDDFDALSDYQHDRYHCDVVKKHMHAVTERSISIDFSI